MELGNPKNVFWEALLLTIIVFVFGIFIGYAIEGSRVGSLNEYYVNSEIFLIDVMALNNVIETGNFSCGELIHANLKFADRIYEEAKILNDYDEANKLSGDIVLIHKRYDLLRTLLWTSASNTQKQCNGNFSIVIYLYDRETKDLAKRATQNVWSKILSDFKEKRGAEIVLIPISVENDLSSLQTLIGKYKIKNFPVVIVNDKIITQLSSVEELEKYLN